jgi:hypothetical protein
LRKNFRFFATVAGPALLLFVAGNAALILWFGRHGGEDLEWLSREHAALLGLLLVQRSVLALPVLLLNGNLLFEQRPAPGAIVWSALKLYPRYLWHQAIWLPIMTIGLSWTFIGPWRGLVTHFFKSEVIVLERLKGSAMLKRLAAMSAGQGERNVGFLLLDAAVFALSLLALGFGFNILLSMMLIDGRYWWLDARFSLFSPVMHLLILGYGVFHTTAKFLYYIDNRSLREGWDVELTLVKGIRETEEIA